MCQRCDANKVPAGVSVVGEEEPGQVTPFHCRVQKALGQGSAHQHDSHSGQEREASPQSSPQATRGSELPPVLQWTPGPSTSSSESPGPALLPAGPASQSWSQEGLRSQKAPLGQGPVRAGAPKPKSQHGVSLPGAQEGDRHAGVPDWGAPCGLPLLPCCLPALLLVEARPR